MRRSLAIGIAVLAFSIARPSGAETGAFEPFGAHNGPSGSGLSGAPVGGYALSLSADAPVVPLGSPIWVTVELRPVSGDTMRVLYGSRHSSYQFTIVRRSDGGVAPPVPNDFGVATISGPVCGRVLPAGHSLFGRFQLGEMYAITRPGKYSVTVVGRPVIDCKPVSIESNTITVTVLP